MELVLTLFHTATFSREITCEVLTVWMCIILICNEARVDWPQEGQSRNGGASLHAHRLQNTNINTLK